MLNEASDVNLNGQKKIKIIIDISSRFFKTWEEISAITVAGANCIHVDVMDGRAVPFNSRVGSYQRYIKYAEIPFSVHLMITL